MIASTSVKRAMLAFAIIEATMIAGALLIHFMRG